MWVENSKPSISVLTSALELDPYFLPFSSALPLSPFISPCLGFRMDHPRREALSFVCWDPLGREAEMIQKKNTIAL